MGPTVISGLPAHILLVHVVLAIVPVAAVLVVIAAIWRPARRWLNWLPFLAALGALIAVPITTHAGHWLEHHLRSDVTPAIQHHVNLGNQMLPWVLALFFAALLVLGVGWAESGRSFRIGHSSASATTASAPNPRAALAGRRTVRIVVAIIAIVAAAGAVQQVYRTGEAGSRAVWSGTFSN